MSSPTKEELPKIADSLKSELESEHHLKHQQVNEKIVLPTKQDVEQEKQQEELLKGIESFESNKLKHTETQEKFVLPTKEQIETEKTLSS